MRLGRNSCAAAAANALARAPSARGRRRVSGPRARRALRLDDDEARRSRRREKISPRANALPAKRAFRVRSRALQALAVTPDGRSSPGVNSASASNDERRRVMCVLGGLVWLAPGRRRRTPPFATPSTRAAGGTSVAAFLARAHAGQKLVQPRDQCAGGRRARTRRVGRRSRCAIGGRSLHAAAARRVRARRAPQDPVEHRHIPRLGGLADAVVDLLVHHAQGRAQALRLRRERRRSPPRPPALGAPAPARALGVPSAPALRRRSAPSAARRDVAGRCGSASARGASARASRARAAGGDRRGRATAEAAARASGQQRETLRGADGADLRDATPKPPSRARFFHPTSRVLRVRREARAGRALAARSAREAARGRGAAVERARPKTRGVARALARRSASTRTASARAELANAVPTVRARARGFVSRARRPAESRVARRSISRTRARAISAAARPERPISLAAHRWRAAA